MAKYSLEDKVSPDREPLCKVTPIIKSKGTTALRSPNSQLSSALAPLYLLNPLWLWEVGVEGGVEGCGGLEQNSRLAQVSAVFVCLFVFQELETSLLAFSMAYCAVSHPYFCFSTCFNLDLPGELARFSLATSWKPTQKGAIQKTF